MVSIFYSAIKQLQIFYSLIDTMLTYSGYSNFSTNRTNSINCIKQYCAIQL